MGKLERRFKFSDRAALGFTAVNLGDSLSKLNTYSDATTYRQVLNRSWWAYCSAYLGGKIRMLNVAATEGHKISDAMLRVDSEVLPYYPTFAFIMIGINTVHAFSDASEFQVQWNYLKENIIDKVLNAGEIPIVFTIPPSTNINTATKLAGWHYLNNKITEYAIANPNIGLAPIHGLTDPASEGQPLAGTTVDGVHFNTVTAENAGYAAAKAVLSFMPAITHHHGSVLGDVYNGCSNTQKGFYSTLTAGTKSGTPTPSGNAPTDWTINASCTNATGITIESTLQAATDGQGDWVEITLSGSGMTGQSNCFYSIFGTFLQLAGSEFSVGDNIEHGFECEVDSATDLISIESVVDFGTVTDGRRYYHFPRALNGAQALTKQTQMKGLLSPVIPVPAGCSQMRQYIYVRHQTGLSAADSVIRFRNPFVRKISNIILPTNSNVQ